MSDEPLFAILLEGSVGDWDDVTLRRCSEYRRVELSPSSDSEYSKTIVCSKPDVVNVLAEHGFDESEVPDDE